MENYIIPTTVVDNFFDDPQMVREFADLQTYLADPSHQWPGKRTESIHKLNPTFFSNTINKFMQIFYSENEHVEWSGYGFFHRIGDEYDHGWVHVDGTLITGIIYLDEKNNPHSGTTIYQPKILGEQMLHADKRIETNKYPNKTTEHKSFRDENEDQFEESIILKNKFNRLVAFDSHLYHAGGSFSNLHQNDRLTMIFFLDKLFVNTFPLQRAKRR